MQDASRRPPHPRRVKADGAQNSVPNFKQIQAICQEGFPGSFERHCARTPYAQHSQTRLRGDQRDIKILPWRCENEAKRSQDRAKSSQEAPARQEKVTFSFFFSFFSHPARPKSAQERPKRVPRGSKGAQERPKSLPREAQELPRGLQK